MSIDHYENFPVASWLCPAPLRPPIEAIYHFARTADDLADEGEVSTAQRLSDLQAYRAELTANADGRSPSPRWAPVFERLRRACAQHALPWPLLHALLDAFEQDLHQSRHPDRASLLAYCSRSANPVGRLLLHLYGVDDAQALRQSDAICTALQLINFWQDVSRDRHMGRIYVPQDALQAASIADTDWLAGADHLPVAQVLRPLCEWAEALMHDGAPLVHRLPGRVGWELRLVVQGGLRILEKIAAMHHDTLHARPTLGPWDAPRLAWRALRMRSTLTSTEPRA